LGTILKFFSLTYAVSWTLFIIAIVLSRGTELTAPGLLTGLLVFIGTISPALVALLLTARTSGSLGLGMLLRRLFQWRVGARWYVFALGFMAVIKVTVALTHRMLIGSWPEVGHQPYALVLIAILFSTPIQSGEEIGWRGYALPLLADRVGYGRGSVLLGVVWAGWHLPLFFLRVPGNDEYGQSFPVWAMGVTALSVAIAWLYAHTNGSLLLTMLMHAAVNNSPHFLSATAINASNTFSLSASRVAWLTAAFLSIAAGYFLVRMPRSSPRFRR
jgi:membrane protease YdiL (CAAX protease family)